MAAQQPVDTRVEEEKLSLPPGWQRIPSDQGFYYWHSATDHSQWEFPKGHPTAAAASLLDYENVTPKKPPMPPRGLKPKKKTGYVNLDYTGGTADSMAALSSQLELAKAAEQTKSELPRREGEMKSSEVKIPDDKMQQESPKKEVIYDTPPIELAYETPKKSLPQHSDEWREKGDQGESTSAIYDSPKKKQEEVLYDNHKKKQAEALYDVPSDAMEATASVVYDTPKKVPENTTAPVVYDLPRKTGSGDVTPVVYDSPKKAQSDTKAPVASEKVGGAPAVKPKPVVPPPYKGKSKKEPPKKPKRRSLSPEFNTMLSPPPPLSTPSLSAPSSPLPVAKSTVHQYDQIDLDRDLKSDPKGLGYDHLGQKAVDPYDHIPASPAPTSSANPYDSLATKDDGASGSRGGYDRLLSQPGSEAVRKTVPGQYDRLPSSSGDGDGDLQNELDQLKQKRQERIQRHNYEEVGDEEQTEELVWDDTPMHKVYQEVAKRSKAVGKTKPLPPVSNPDEDESVYAQIDLRKKSKEERLPDGWEVVQDADKTYYWHVPSGKTQWEPPVAVGGGKKEEFSPPPIPTKTDDANILIDAVPSSVVEEEREVGVMDEIQGADLRISSLNIGGSSPGIRRQMWDSSVDGIQSFQAVNVGWVELEERQLLPENSQVTLGEAMRYLSSERVENEQWSPATGKLADKGQILYVQLHGIMLKILTADTKIVLMAQSITGIRVYGSGRDNPKHFAFVARDRASRKHRCHVFCCSALGKTVTLALDEICNRVMRQRTDKKTREEAGLSQRKLTKLDQMSLPQQQEKKTFVTTYLGRTDVPYGAGIEVLRNAINKLKACNPSQWQEVVVEIMPTNVKIIDQKTQDVIQEHRVSQMSFLGLGQDKRYCGYVLSPSRDIHWCHAFSSEINSGPMSIALKAACDARYQSVVESQRGIPPRRAQSAKVEAPASSSQPSEPKTATTAKGTLKAFFGRFRSQRKDDVPDVSTSLYYLGSENFPGASTQPPSLDIKGPLRRLSATRFEIACQMIVSSTNITLIDTQKRNFSKKLFPLSSIVHCEMAEGSGNVFGFITNKDRAYVCHAFKKLGRHDINSVFASIQARRSSLV